MSAADEILHRVEGVVREKLDWQGQLAPEMRLVEDLELDSMRNLALAIEIENHFRIRLEAEDEATIATVGDLVELIARKLRARKADSQLPREVAGRRDRGAGD